MKSQVLLTLGWLTIQNVVFRQVFPPSHNDGLHIRESDLPVFMFLNVILGSFLSSKMATVQAGIDYAVGLAFISTLGVALLGDCKWIIIIITVHLATYTRKLFSNAEINQLANSIILVIEYSLKCGFLFILSQVSPMQTAYFNPSLCLIGVVCILVNLLLSENPFELDACITSKWPKISIHPFWFSVFLSNCLIGDFCAPVLICLPFCCPLVETFQRDGVKDEKKQSLSQEKTNDSDWDISASAHFSIGDKDTSQAELNKDSSIQELSDWFLSLMKPLYQLESIFGHQQAVAIRRHVLSKDLPSLTGDTPSYKNYDFYENIHNVNCENVIGFTPVPLGLAGPLLVDGHRVYLPMATTEGCLVASTNRGCKALLQAGGVRTFLLGDAMTRCPMIDCGSAAKAHELVCWTRANFDVIKAWFDQTSAHVSLKEVTPRMVGKIVYLRFAASTGKAMGMNMVSKASQQAINKMILKHFPGVALMSLSGNACCDKKSASVNWLSGRGKSITTECVIPRAVIESIFKTKPEHLVRLSFYKNQIGSTVAGAAPGGQNAQAANVIAAAFIATGQDVAQVVESSSCLTVFDLASPSSTALPPDLYISVTMPCLETGVIGGGTRLPPQRDTLALMFPKCDVTRMDSLDGGPGAWVARVMSAGVLASELSLLAALQTDTLVSSHMHLNRACPLI